MSFEGTRERNAAKSCRKTRNDRNGIIRAFGPTRI